MLLASSFSFSTSDSADVLVSLMCFLGNTLNNCCALERILSSSTGLRCFEFSSSLFLSDLAVKIDNNSFELVLGF